MFTTMINLQVRYCFENEICVKYTLYFHGCFIFKNIYIEILVHISGAEHELYFGI